MAAYAPFANGGTAIAPHVIERVRTVAGKTLYTRQAPNFGRIIDARYVGMMNAMMHETLTSGTAHSAQLAGWPAAGKTGTSQDFRDAWFIGYTGHLVTGVWLGNDNSSPTRKATGGGMPVEIWSRFMKPAHQGVPVAGLPEVDTGLSLASLLSPSGARSRPAPVGVSAGAAAARRPQHRPRQLVARAAVRPPLERPIGRRLITPLRADAEQRRSKDCAPVSRATAASGRRAWRGLGTRP